MAKVKYGIGAEKVMEKLTRETRISSLKVILAMKHFGFPGDKYNIKKNGSESLICTSPENDDISAYITVDDYYYTKNCFDPKFEYSFTKDESVTTFFVTMLYKGKLSIIFVVYRDGDGGVSFKPEEYIKKIKGTDIKYDAIYHDDKIGVIISHKKDGKGMIDINIEGRELIKVYGNMKPNSNAFELDRALVKMLKEREDMTRDSIKEKILSASYSYPKKGDISHVDVSVDSNWTY